MTYHELQVTTHFSFLRGASSADQLFATAAALRLPALGITDRNSVGGVVRALVAAEKFTDLGFPIRMIAGCRLDLVDGTSLLVWPEDRAAWSRLTRLLTLGKSRAAAQKGEKGQCFLHWEDVAQHAEGLVGALVPSLADHGDAVAMRWMADVFGERGHVCLTQHRRPGDALRLYDLDAMGQRFGLTPLEAMASGVPVVATTVGAFPELVVEGETGSLVPPGDVDAMVAAVGTLLDDPDRRSRMAAAARAHAFAAAGEAWARTAARWGAEEKDDIAQIGEETTISLLEAGVYWRRSVNNWLFSARGSAGYAWFDGDRVFVSPTDALIRQADSGWNGFTGLASLSAAYEANIGVVYIRPLISLDYLYLSEGSREETGGQDAFNLFIEERTSSRLSGTAEAALAATL
eukprot:gene31297-41705_t